MATEPDEMADGLTLTWFPPGDRASEQEIAFARELLETFESAGVDVVDLDDRLTSPPIGRVARWLTRGAIETLKNPIAALVDGSDGRSSHRPGLAEITDMRLGPKIEPGTAVLAAGDGEAGQLPVDYMGDFRDVTILTVIEKPDDVREAMPFTDHYETALELFAYHMTNVVVGVDEDEWFVYNFNGSHPFYDRDDDLEARLKSTLIPKLAAPIRPPDLDDFDIREQAFDPEDAEHEPAIADLVDAGALLETSGLYPEGTDLDDLPWRNDFYRWAGKIHLDDRSGMSYGFLARQLPTEPAPVMPLGQAEVDAKPGHLVEHESRLHAVLDTPEGPLVARVPDVWMMTLRSGCDKTDPDPVDDMIKLGLSNGQMAMATPESVPVEGDVRPSFDTLVILAHAVGNAIAAGVLDHVREEPEFADQLAEDGMALAHWHGYLAPDHVPDGWHVHGAEKPHVSCGTPQAGLFALDGKLEALEAALSTGEPFLGDVHVEPQHGTNLTFPTLGELGAFLAGEEDVAALGNEHLDAYKQHTATAKV